LGNELHIVFIVLESEIQQLLDKYPFLSFVVYGGNDYIGIIQNYDEIITTLYDYSAIKAKDERLLFLELADTWWWESNRMIPINVFIKQEWLRYRPILKTFNSKDVIIKYGPYLSLKDLSKKRTKRRAITLVRKPM
jgi:hypothetical protein